MWLWWIVAVVAMGCGIWVLIAQPLPSTAATRVGTVRADPARLETHVRVLSERLIPRDARHPENLARVADYVRDRLQEVCGVVSEQRYEVESRSYANVIARLGPDTEERVVVGAHCDTDGPFPGADDNASGIAGLLELARMLSPLTLPMGVELVAYALEEMPFFRTDAMGSAVHARALREAGVGVRAMVGLEMIGYFTDAPGSQLFPLPLLKLFYPSRGDFIAVVGALGKGSLVRRVKGAMRVASPLPVHSINAPRAIPGIDFSDHMNYWDAGYPAVMVTDTAFYRNPYYHSSRDLPETLDYRRMAMVVEGIHAAVLAVME